MIYSIIHFIFITKKLFLVINFIVFYNIKIYIKMLFYKYDLIY